MGIGQNIPLFFRLYHKLKLDIIRGEIPRGTRLETIGELSQKHSVSQSSVRKSLDLLEREGLLVRKRGWGTTVPKDLKLYFFDLGRVIQSKKTLQEMKRADIRIYDCCWVKPNFRIRHALNGNDTDAHLGDQEVLKIDSWISFPGKFNFKAGIIYYFTKSWLDKNGMADGAEPREILLTMSQWIMCAKLRLKEALLPFICTDEFAESLGLPDGTPVFHHTVMIRDKIDAISCCWEMISSANLFYREIDLD